MKYIVTILLKCSNRAYYTALCTCPAQIDMKMQIWSQGRHGERQTQSWHLLNWDK